LALAFLNTFVPLREPTFDPSDPAETLGLAKDYAFNQIPDHLENNVACHYSWHFRNTRNEPPYIAILAYNDDGSLILGLSGDEEEAAALNLLGRLEAFAGSRGYWGVEEPPQCSRRRFLARLELRCT